VRQKPKPAWARQHLEPQRVEEIQRALAEAGYFHGEPTGQWDEQTRDAMRRYQASNGFAATGLPDAKSLMKLGLGPHPLPADVGPKSSATASLDPSTKTDSQPDPAPQR
jgi:peptidoglycan hydrolase-like protein with peptidoglycan-binding domain